jgi:hypothetical protein
LSLGAGSVGAGLLGAKRKITWVQGPGDVYLPASGFQPAQ